MLTLKGQMDSRFRGNEWLALGHTSVFLGLRLGSLIITGSQSMPRHEPMAQGHAGRARLLAMLLWSDSPQAINQPIDVRNRMRRGQRDSQACRSLGHCRRTNRWRPNMHFLQARHSVQRRFVVTDDQRLNRRLRRQ